MRSVSTLRTLFASVNGPVIGVFRFTNSIGLRLGLQLCCCSMVLINTPTSLPPLLDDMRMLSGESSLAKLHYPPVPTHRQVSSYKQSERPRAPDPQTQKPIVYPGGRVIWKETESSGSGSGGASPATRPQLDLQSVRHVATPDMAELLGEQRLPHSMSNPPRVPPAPSAMILQIAGLDPSISIDSLRLRSEDSPGSWPRPSTPGALGLPPGLLAESRGSPGAALARAKESNPSSREQVIRLEGQLKQQLAAASHSLGGQMVAWDAAFAEVARQVRVTCAERSTAAAEDLPCMHVLTTAPRPHRCASRARSAVSFLTRSGVATTTGSRDCSSRSPRCTPAPRSRPNLTSRSGRHKRSGCKSCC